MAMIQKRPAIPGRVAWVDHLEHYDLPPSLQNGEEVTIVSSKDGQVLVRKANGEEVTVWHVHLDTGWRYCITNRWQDESRPEVLDYIEKRIKWVESRPEHPAFPGSKNRDIHAMRVILARNGRVVPAPA